MAPTRWALHKAFEAYEADFGLGREQFVAYVAAQIACPIMGDASDMAKIFRRLLKQYERLSKRK